VVVVVGIAAPLLLLAGLARLPGGEAWLLLTLEAPFNIGIAVLLFGESLARREVVGAAAVVLGGVVLASGPSEGSMHVLGALAIDGEALRKNCPGQDFAVQLSLLNEDVERL